MSKGIPSIINGRVTKGSKTHAILEVLAIAQGEMAVTELGKLCGTHRSNALEQCRTMATLDLVHERWVSVVKPGRRGNNASYHRELRYTITPQGRHALATLMTPSEAYWLARQQEDEPDPEDAYKEECAARKREFDRYSREALAKALTKRRNDKPPATDLRSINRRYYREWRAKFARWEAHDEAYYVARHKVRISRVDGTGQYAEAS